ncbi:hypothetical protein GLOTRDRAFT_76409 [Gloeophyllum trabeum ATCC 11539]|uniref:3-oxo-5-alpha-steroid 4-dehydrogenase C-terminal domain-containing protein n=1 Tax=Gloeophyllum trabeum (strain ATCC 11539 / FP-39264 / Madison 617) TaxID=670483 RepID=S7RQE8_GLOTA|nr:uncharacterized protein GLOTRDRAFT_76409 [Gloeophyllum trabeum ATCC 11539]EPQ55109.1 hypothetical protein GLOTRDRAFT_76409 [Gloeophyllum trabeum ATCC 11539]
MSWMHWKPNVADAMLWYDTARKWFAVVPALTTPTTFFINAPFGRFSPKGDSIFLVDGIKSWILMELVSPAFFIYTYLASPLTHTTHIPSPSDPTTPFVALFLTHYLNRAVLSPLRTPTRSKSHIMVPLAAVAFNTINGSLLGTYLSSPAATAFLVSSQVPWKFYAGLALWLAGFAGNILHDEILLNIRRKSIRDAKKAEAQGKEKPKNHYAIPHGYLYSLISYPNYFCEWVEWFGFALACAPMPSFASGAEFLRTVSPPWLFFMAEVCTMLPRAYKGHQWYHEKFPDYPKDRKAVVPFIL